VVLVSWVGLGWVGLGVLLDVGALSRWVEGVYSAQGRLPAQS
jgi:hypothetical protein